MDARWFDFEEHVDRRGSGSAKWTSYPPDVLPMWVADMDFAVAPEIVDALRRRLDHPVFGYATATAELREQIVASLHERYAWTIAADEIVFLPGVEPGFNMALKALTTSGDGVVVNTPVYPPILAAPGHWGLRRLDVPLVPDAAGRYGMDRDAFRAALTNASIYLLCNPHNPVGKMFRRDELEALAADCLARDAWIVSDEIHCDLAFDGRRHVPIASLDEAVAKRTITLMAASKTWNIAGLKTAFAIVKDASVRRRFDAMRLGMVDSVNVFGLTATLAAYRDGEPWRRALLEHLAGNRDHLVDAVRTKLPGIRMTNPEGTFLAWLDCSALGLEPDPQQFFLERGRLALSAGADFGADHRAWVRLNFGCTRATLDDGIDRLVSALATTNSGH
jgi:cystathionine beta-lyase